jgi:hypothetical protein
MRPTDFTGRYPDPRSRDTAQRIWDAYAPHMFGDRCAVANQTIARQADVSVSTVKRRLREWQAWGWITRTTRVRATKVRGRYRECERRGHPRAWQAASLTTWTSDPPCNATRHQGNNICFRATTRRDRGLGEVAGAQVARSGTAGAGGGAVGEAFGAGDGAVCVPGVRRWGAGAGGLPKLCGAGSAAHNPGITADQLRVSSAVPGFVTANEARSSIRTPSSRPTTLDPSR